MAISVDQLLTALLVYGYPALFAVVLAGSLGVPIPTDLLILAAGGFAAEGELDLVTVLGLVFAAAILGDCTVYGVARWAGDAAVRRHVGRVGLSAERLAAAEARLGTWLGLGVFMTRWLLTPLSLPATLLAAIGRYPAPWFVAFAAAGELLWTGVFVGIGYLFGESWSGILQIVQDSVGLVAGLGVAAVAIGMLLWLVRARSPGRGTSPAARAAAEGRG
ncbi:MAG TPA: DedA family protein [Chloroflexota bacterium]|nr:DedA family protein [Chloroflexota bacterium]